MNLLQAPAPERWHSWGPICQGLCKGQRNSKAQERLPTCPLHHPIIGHQSHQWMLWPLCSQQVWLPRSWTLKLLALCHIWAMGAQLWEPPGLDLASPDISPEPSTQVACLLHPSQGLKPTAHTGWTYTPIPSTVFKNSLQNPPSSQSLQGITSSQVCFRLLQRQKGL